MPDHADLWQGLLAHPELLSALLARLSPAAIARLRQAALPGERSNASGLELLRVPRLTFYPLLSDQQLRRVVQLPCWQLWDAKRRRWCAPSLSRAAQLTALESAR
jgi:hypothetical protein